MIRTIVLCAAVAFAVGPALTVPASAQTGYEDPDREPPRYQPRPRHRDEEPTYRRERREPYGGCRFVIRPVDDGYGYKQDKRVLVCPPND